MNYSKNDNIISFIDIPDEISLLFSITGCTIQCKDCHSKYLWDKNNGNKLTLFSFLSKIIKYKKTISCILFFGGEKEPLLVYLFLSKLLGFKTALFTGLSKKEDISLCWRLFLDYLKIGPYKKDFGGLSNSKTNQRLYYRNKDITYKYWSTNA